MSKEWQSVTLAEISDDISYGYTASASNLPCGPKFLRITDIQGGVVDWENVPYCEINERDFKKNRLKTGDIVIARTGNSTGENYMFDSSEDCVFASYLIRFRISEEKANPYYVWLNLRTKGWLNFIAGSKSGSAQAGANAKVLGQYEIRLPDREAQDVIAKVFLDINNKIALNRQINQTLEAMAQALFKSWFVDFEPVKAKMSALAVGGSADDANLAAMSAISGKTTEQLLTLKTTHPDQFQQLYTTADLFPSEMVDSELGEIPKGWEVKAFGDVIDKYIDNRGKTPPLVDDGIPLLEVKHLTETSAFPNLKADKKISEDTYNTWFRAHVQEKDILISTVGTIGRTSFVKDTNLAIAQNVLGLRFSEKVTPEYMFYLIKDSNFQHGVNSRLVITVQSSIKRKDLNTISLLVPSNNIVMHFSSKISDNLNAQFSLYKEIEFLIDLRDALLPKLLSGELSLINDNFKEST